MKDILEITGLKKSFGTRQVIDGLDLAVPERSIFGFIGPNGSGKTTTMKMVLGLLKPDSGMIRVCGEKVRYGETKTNRFIGYLPDVPEFYGYMKPLEYLHLCGRITGMSKAETLRKGEELLATVGLGGTRQKIAGFSRGMKQRLGIAQALLNEPRLLICDEPTSALDPIGRKEILEILAKVRGKTTVVFSTHILSDVERICDRIAVLHKGRIVLCGTLEDVKARHTRTIHLIEFANPRDLERYQRALTASDGGSGGSGGDDSNDDGSGGKDIGSGSNGNGILTACGSGNGNGILTACGSLELKIPSHEGHRLIDLLSSLGITPLRFEMLEPNLEDLFIEAIRDPADN